MNIEPIDEQMWIEEKRRLFKRVVIGFALTVAAGVLFSTYWMMGQDAYHDHLAEAPAGELMPDGSPRVQAEPQAGAPESAPAVETPQRAAPQDPSRASGGRN